jgi:hypothetical protein
MLGNGFESRTGYSRKVLLSDAFEGASDFARAPERAPSPRRGLLYTVTLIGFLAMAIAWLAGPEPAHAHPPVANWHRWLRVASCESGQRWAYGPNNHGPVPWSGYYGGLQYSAHTWTAVQRGKRLQYRTADLAPRWVQILRSEQLRRADGLHHWPRCGARWY